MPQLTIHVNAKPYIVGCDDGEEAHLQALAGLIDAKVREVDPGAGAQLGETRLMLLGALVIADELSAAKARAAAADAEVAGLREALARAEARAVDAVEAAAHKIEAMATR
ncbi:MAG: cell division protein ZapA [Caulobacteraceae bacterium]